MECVRLALRSAKTASAADLVCALETMKPYRGSTGLYQFTAAGHNGPSADDIKIVIDHNRVWETLESQ